MWGLPWFCGRDLAFVIQSKHVSGVFVLAERGGPSMYPADKCPNLPPLRGAMLPVHPRITVSVCQVQAHSNRKRPGPLRNVGSNKDALSRLLGSSASGGNGRRFPLTPVSIRRFARRVYTHSRDASRGTGVRAGATMGRSESVFGADRKQSTYLNYRY